MCDAKTPADSCECHDVDVSTDEGMRAVELFQQLALDLRSELKSDPLERKVALYERTLGLAVMPVLLRRAVLRARRSLAERGGDRR